MKKTISLLLILVLLCSMLPFAMADGEPSFVVSSASAQAGEEVTVTVSLANNPGIASFEFDVVYDSNVLEWTAVEKGSMAGTWDVSVGDAITWIDAENHTDNGVIATLTFTVKEGVAALTTEVTIDYDPDNVFDENADNVEFAIVPGTVTITEPSSTVPTPYISGLGATLTDAMDLKLYVKDVPEGAQFAVALEDRTAKPVVAEVTDEAAYAQAKESVFMATWDETNSRWVIRVKVYPKWLNSAFTFQVEDGSGTVIPVKGYAYGDIGSATVEESHSYSFLDYLAIMSTVNSEKYGDLYDAIRAYHAAIASWS